MTAGAGVLGADEEAPPPTVATAAPVALAAAAAAARNEIDLQKTTTNTFSDIGNV